MASTNEDDLVFTNLSDSQALGMLNDLCQFDTSPSPFLHASPYEVCLACVQRMTKAVIL